MPVVTCPNCPTKLKVPDGAKGNVKCPKCTTIFPVGTPTPAAAFEVVDDSPPRPAPASKPAAPLPKPSPVQAASADDHEDFEVIDEKPKKKKRAADEDDDEEDEKPKKKKKKKRAADEDDDEDWRPRPGSNKRGAFAKGKVGALLLSISCWLNLGAFGLLALYVLIAWVGLIVATNSTPSTSSSPPPPRSERSGERESGIDGAAILDLIAVLPGLAGLGAWTVGLVGCGFAIAGPPRARGMAITATVFATIHLVLLGITFDNMQGGMGEARGLPGVGKLNWIVVASILPAKDTFLPTLISKYTRPMLESSFYLVALAAAICELLRLVFILQTLRLTADAAGDGYAAEKANFSAKLVYLIAGVVPLVVLVMLFVTGLFKGSGRAHTVFLTMLGLYGAYAFMMLNPAMAALQTKTACDRRS